MENKVLYKNSNLKLFLFTIVWIVLLSLSLLNITPIAVQNNFSLIVLIITLVISAIGKLEYAYLVIIPALLAHGFLTKNIMGTEEGVSGLNVGTILSVWGLIVFYIRHYRRADTNVAYKNLFYFLIAFVIIDLLVIIGGIEFTFSKIFNTIAGYLRIICVVLWSYHLGKTFTKNKFNSFAFIISISPVLVAISLVIGFMTIDPYSAESLMYARLAGLFDPNFTMTAFGLVPIFLVLFSMYFIKRTIFKLISYIIPLLCFGIIFLSGSRTALISTSLGIITVLIITLRAKFFLWVIFIFIGLVFMFSMLPLPLQDRFVNAESGFEDTRSQFAQNALNEFSKSPLWGTGKDTYRLTSNFKNQDGAHNTFFAYLAEGGIVYGSLFLIIIFVLIKINWKVYKNYNKMMGILGIGLCISYLISSMGITYTLADYTTPVFAAFISLILGFNIVNKKTQIATH